MKESNFPSWAKSNKTGRLKFMIRHLASFASEEGHLVFLCRDAKLSVRGVSQAIDRGEFTFQMADKLVKAASVAGNPDVTVMNLLKPMESFKEDK
ncbi:hypothetical protein PJ037_003369 [Proteus mirabilis]|nr:hypothetical protein [Proteus mirabilis]